jgi:AcrR family transcriptional regulator
MSMSDAGGATTGAEDVATISDHAAKRLAILEGAAEVFVRRGFAAGTTKEIAAEVGLSQPAIYHYVGSKHDLLREIALHVDEEMNGALARGLAVSEEPGRQLRGIIHEFTAAVVRDRRAFAVFWQELYSLPEDVRTRIAEDERAFVGAVAAIVEALQADHRMPPGSPLVLAEAVLSMPSWMYHWYRPAGPLSAQEIAELYCRLVGLDPS